MTLPAHSGKEERWTIYVCPRCGYMDPDQYSREDGRPRYCIFAGRGLSRDGVLLHPYSGAPEWEPEVEYVPIEVRRA